MFCCTLSPPAFYIVSYDEDHMLNQTVIDEAKITYNNVLTVTKNEPGNYQCNVTNTRGSASSQSLLVDGKHWHARISLIDTQLGFIIEFTLGL